MRSVKPVDPKSRVAPTTSATGKKEVDAFMSKLDHPLKTTIELLREIVLSSNKGVTEHIKWKAPSFLYDGDDKITFNLHKAHMVMVIFHRGAKAKDSKGKENLFGDTTALLEWLSPDRAVAKFTGLEELKAKEGHFKRTVKKWLSTTKAK